MARTNSTGSKDTSEEHRAELLAGQGDYAGANAEDPDEYKAESVFWVPAEARWSHLQANTKQPTIERDNPRLKGVLPKDYALANPPFNDSDWFRKDDDGDPFEEKMPRLVAELHAQFAEGAKLEQAITANLKGLGYAR